MTTEIEAEAGREAEHGEKTIAIVLRFFTDDIAERKGDIRPKHMADMGTARVVPNSAHEIESAKPLFFHSLAEIPTVIEDLLIQHKITVHPGTIGKTRKYLANV
jgi:hypothetical protein